MSFDRSTRESELDLDIARGTAGAPGRSTITSRHVMRKERDDNGIAPGADQAVERAAGSSGTPLPGELRERFESSLGADLSGVRIHTGAASADATSAVGARAYATGQDIHFNEGQYNPSTSDGQFLIAHEVAHTVQQSGGAAAGRQNKLEVSQSGDALEAQADVAAMSMVRGAPVSFELAGGGATIARRIETRTDVEKAGDAGAADPAAQGGLGGSTCGEIKVQGKDAALALKNDIASWQGRLGQNAGMEGYIAKNIGVMGQLENVGAASDCVGFAVSGFTSLFNSTKGEYGRLMAMASSPQFAGLGFGKPDAASGDAAAEDHAKKADGEGSTASDLAARAAKIADTTGANGGENKVLKSALEEVKNSEAETQAAATDVADKQTMVTASMTGVTGAHQTLAGVKARTEAASIKDAYDKAKAQYEALKKSLEDGFKFLEKIKSVTGDAIESPAKAAQGVAWDVFQEVAAAVLLPEPPNASEEKKAARKQEEADVAAFNGAVNTFNTEGKKVGGVIKAFSESCGRLQRAKAEHKRKVKELGQKFDAADPAQKGKTRKPGEAGTFEMIGVFQGQADAFLATAEATKQVGQRDLTREGTGAGGDVHPTESAAKSAANTIKDAQALTAYKIEDRMTEVSDTDPNETGAEGGPGVGGKTTMAMRAHLTLVPVRIESDLKDDETTYIDPRDHEGLEGSVHKALAELDGYVTQIKAYKAKLGGVMGL
jgi:hypothetical protein